MEQLSHTGVFEPNAGGPLRWLGPPCGGLLSRGFLRLRGCDIHTSYGALLKGMAAVPHATQPPGRRWSRRLSKSAGSLPEGAMLGFRSAPMGAEERAARALHQSP